MQSININNINIIDVRSNPGDSGFLIDDGKTAILYDSGFGFLGYALADKLKDYLGNRQLDYIFLTHSHYDHALGSAYVRRYYPNVKVVAGKYAEYIFSRDSAKKIMNEMDLKYAKKCGISEYDSLVEELSVDIACEDKDVIKAGELTFEVIELPGHTKCSVGYYNAENRLLLACETIGVYGGNGIIMPSFLTSYEATLNSIRRVKELDIDRIVSPHYGVLTSEETAYFFENMEIKTIEFVDSVISGINDNLTDAELIEEFKNIYWHNHIKNAYPEDALTLNTGIMINEIRRYVMSTERTGN